MHSSCRLGVAVWCASQSAAEQASASRRQRTAAAAWAMARSLWAGVARDAAARAADSAAARASSSAMPHPGPVDKLCRLSSLRQPARNSIPYNTSAPARLRIGMGAAVGAVSAATAATDSGAGGGGCIAPSLGALLLGGGMDIGAAPVATSGISVSVPFTGAGASLSEVFMPDAILLSVPCKTFHEVSNVSCVSKPGSHFSRCGFFCKQQTACAVHAYTLDICI